MIKHYKPLLLLTISTLLGGIAIHAQNETLLTVGDHHYSIDEFNYIYNKNHSITQNPLNKEEYVPLFVNYKLKVLEAIEQGYDTMPAFKKELNYYRDELSKPYLTDQKATEDVIEEAYNHLSYEINAYHILIKLPQDASPADTAAAYNKLMEIKPQITDLASFEKKAREISECPSAAQGGNLGYFTAFMMVYPFEKAAYETEVGHVSDIVKSPFGYHLIFVNDKRPNKGEIKVAHIMKAFPQNAPQKIKDDAKTSIDSIYNALKAGADFEEMVQENSDDRNSVRQNGELPWFSSGRMVPEFSEAAFALTENEQISEPILTPFGWHIIKRLDARPIQSLEEATPDILQKIKRDERAYAGKKATIAKLRKAYNYTEDENGLLKAQKVIISAKGKESSAVLSQLGTADVPMATFASSQLTSQNFASYLKRNRVPLQSIDQSTFAKAWESFANDTIIAYEKSILETKYPEFQYLINEYHDGLLIFEISQNEIWNKASQDSSGLANYYNNHRETYDLQERYEGTLFFCQKKKDLKKIKALINDSEFVLTDSLKTEISSYAKIEEGAFTKGEYTLLDQQIWNAPKTKGKDEYPLLITDGELKPAQKRDLNEVKGQVLSDYQNYLEEEWIKQLRDKYNPVVNMSILN